MCRRLHHYCTCVEGYGLFERISDAVIRYRMVKIYLFIWKKNNNCMTCNPSNCKELAFMKKGNAHVFDRVAGIPQFKDLVLLGVTFQSDTRFNIHVKINSQKQTSLSTCSGRLEERGAIRKKMSTYSILLCYLTCHMGLRCMERLKLN